MTHSATNAYELFLDVYLQELMEMSDADILEGVDAEAEKVEGLRLFAAAKAEAGRRRMARARAAMAQAASKESGEDVGITPDEARRFIRAAVNDSRFTLAARQLNELSDEDVLRVYFQIKKLQSSDDGGSSSEP